jgi:hypothetical protein
MAENNRVVGLVVRAKDEFSKVFGALEQAGRKAQLQFVRESRKALDATTYEIGMLSKEIRQLSGDGRTSAKVLTQMGKEKAILIGKAKVLAENLDRVMTSVRTTNNQAKGSYAAFDKMADGMDVSIATAARLRKELQDLGAAAAKSYAQQAAARSLPAGGPAVQQFGLAGDEFVRAAQVKKAELKALLSEENALSAAMRSTDVATDAATASMNAAVPALNLKTAATMKATVAERAHAAAIELGASGRTMSGPVGGGAGARDRNRGKRGESQEVEVFGLKPWQLTNLGYQVNDVVSGIAMGQPLIQVFAQQAGQVAQIWPDVMVSIARGIPVLVGLGAAFAPVIAALVRVNQESDSIAIFSRELALSADGSLYSAASLAKTATELDKAVGNIADARKLVSTLAKEGISESSMIEIVKMAKQLAVVTGTDIPVAAEKIAKAFTGNVDSVRELDRELNFLTADQLEHIKTLEASGNKTEALSAAQDILQERLRATVQPMSDWDQAINDMTTAWDLLVTALIDSGAIGIAISGLELLALSARGTAAIVKGAAEIINPPKQTPGQRYGELSKEIANVKAEIAELTSDPLGLGFGAESPVVAGLTEKLALLTAEYDALVVELTRAKTTQDEVTDSVVETADETERLKKANSEIDDLVTKHTDELTKGISAVGEMNREQTIQNELLIAKNKAMEEANRLGIEYLGLTEQQTAAIRDAAGAKYDSEYGAKLSGNLGSYVDKVTGVESGGNPSAKNPNSSATGLGQFIESTWLDMFRRYFPDRAASMSESAILELRKESEISRTMIELYAAENAKLLESAGLAVTEASLYLSHFLGSGGARAVLSARSDVPVSDILGEDQIAANESILRGKTAGQVVGWANRKMNTSDAEIAGNERLAELETERKETVDEFNESLATRLENQKAEIADLSVAGRQAAINKALREAEGEAIKAGTVLSAEQRAEIEATTAALYDRQNIEADVNRIMEQRGLLVEALRLAQSNGDGDEATRLLAEITDLDAGLLTAVDSAIAFWEAIGGPQADVAIQKLENLKSGFKGIEAEMRENVLPTAEDLNRQIVDVGGDAFTAFAQAIANGENVADAFFNSLKQGFAEIVIEIGKAIVKQALLNAIMGGASGPSGGPGGFISGLLSGIFHGGGIAGQPSVTRMVNPAIFANATRYHGGGLVGGEVPAILLREEEVLTRDDPRHALNGGGASPTVNVKSVNVFDPVDVLKAALADEVGEQVFFNFAQSRARRLKGIVG